MKHLNRIVCFLLIAAIMLCSCGSEAKRTTQPYGEGAPSLYKAFEGKFRVGAAINSWDLDDPTSWNYQTIVQQYNTLVLENESKPDAIHPSEDQYYFDKFDKFVDFCEEHNITPRGHTLIWHSQVPGWFFKDGNQDASAELVLERIKEHVTTIVSRYKGRVKSWDVVNEVIGDGEQLRFSDWSRLVGDADGDGDKYDFIEAAFIAAHEADPDARLMINDYSLESSTDKAIRMYNAVKKMLEDGVPIDGVGFQMHIGNGIDYDAMKENYEIIARLRDINPDLMIEVTELDVNCYGWGEEKKDVEVTKEFLEQFSKTYTDVFKLMLELSDEGILDSVVMWGYYDGASWLNDGHQNYPMLIDKDHNLKDAYWDVLELAD